jgi:glycosyltransferase involved in cell wall biosynthesis
MSLVRHKARLAATLARTAYLRPPPHAGDGPLVSVVIAAYNRAEVLRYALASALAQRYRRLEVLVVGDACTDASEQVVAAAGDPRVRWHNLERNSGSQAGPNEAGRRMARGELVAYLGQDDLWLPGHVGILVAELARGDADVTSTVTMGVWPPPGAARRFDSPPPGDVVAPSCLMHTRASGEASGGWRDHRTTVLPPDADFVRRLGEGGARFSHVPALTVVKFASAHRPNSYRDGRSDEQAAFSRRLGRRTFVARELATAVLRARAPAPMPAVPPGAARTPGGIVAEYRRIRGLEPGGDYHRPHREP